MRVYVCVRERERHWHGALGESAFSGLSMSKLQLVSLMKTNVAFEGINLLICIKMANSMLIV